MLTSEGTEALVALENAAPEVLFAQLSDSDAYIWPQIRMMFAQATAEKELNSIAVPTSVLKREILTRMLKAYLPKARPVRKAGQKDHCFIVGGGTALDTPEGRTNWLVDGFANAASGQSVVLQNTPIPRAPTRPVFERTYSLDFLRTRADVKTRIAPISEHASRRVHAFVDEVARELPFRLDPNQISLIKKSAVYRLSHAEHFDMRLVRLMDHLRPRFIYMEDASYGTRGHFISMMKDRGIKVVEPQHGWIGSSHGAYNFGAAMSTAGLVKTLPDVLLTFGEFWSSAVRHPGNVIAIGKPHMSVMAESARRLDDRPRDVLVVSSVAEPEAMARFTLSIRDALPPGWGVLFRPHPSERNSMRERYPTLINATRVKVDSVPDVYESLQNVRGVIGVASTVLYEALAMGCPVFVKDSQFTKYYIDDLFGAPVSDEAGIRCMIEKITAGTEAIVSNTVLESLWKPNPMENFERLLEEWRAP